MKQWPYETPGIPDQLFVKGNSPITGVEIRSVIITKLQLTKGDCFWDIGSGTGSVAIEVARFLAEGTVWAVEAAAERIRLIEENTARFGLSNIKTVHGMAPWVLAELPMADRVFIGGSSGQLSAIIREAGQRLNHGGRLVMSAVTLENLETGIKGLSGTPFQNLEVLSFSIARLTSLNEYHLFQPEHSIHILTAEINR